MGSSKNHQVESLDRISPRHRKPYPFKSRDDTYVWHTQQTFGQGNAVRFVERSPLGCKVWSAFLRIAGEIYCDD